MLGAQARRAIPPGYVGHERGRNVRSVWSIPTRPFKGAHFAVFPWELPQRCILAGCPKGGTVLDPFAGSGTTGVVAMHHGRKFVGCELNPEFVKMIEGRFETHREHFEREVG